MAVSEAGPTVVYVDERDRRRECSMRDVASFPLSVFNPVRKPSSYKGQRSLPGRYFFSTTGEHVLYESRLEMKALVMLDFDPDVDGVVAQPFALVFTGDQFSGNAKLHVPDYLVRCGKLPQRLIDVKPAQQASRPQTKKIFDATRDACAVAGWNYEVVTEYDPVFLANVEWLSGFRRRPQVIEEAAPAIAEAVCGSVGRSFGNLVRLLRPRMPETLVRPAVLHLLWTQALCADLSTPLSEDTVVYPNKREDKTRGK